ncbi:MAG: ParB/RepB/Spo0J family partition protein, partial [Candidatus Binatia bacterium]
MGNVISIPLEKITLSKTNPRKHFDPAALADLAENIKIHGVLQPILVRPDGKKHQLVVGERRFRASQKANLKTIPAITKKLTDEEAFELGMIENLQREDLSEIEEARGYRYMLDKFGYKAEDLAEKINKSRAYIYGRLKLANLCKKGQKALEKGEINASTGLLVARIPGKEQQEKALQEVTEENYWEDTMSYREAKKHIEEHYMVRLKGCGFSTKDEKLIPKAGPCTTCPKRTGNQKELYPNTSADVCTDPECFRAKKDAQTAILIEQAKAKGKAVLTGKDAEKHMEYGRLKYNSPLVDL